MPEFLESFIAWYLAPWRRIGRKEFGIALTLATVPGLLIMLMGWGNSAGSFLDPVLGLADIGQQVGTLNEAPTEAEMKIRSENMQGVGLDPNAVGFNLPQNLPGLPGLGGGGAASAPAPANSGPGIDWSGIINGLCLLAMIPLGRMRLRDMGWFGKPELLLTVIFNISVVAGLIQSLSGYDILPMGMLWGFLNFAGYGWLSFAKSKARLAVHERVPETWEPGHKIDETPIKKRDDYDY